METLETRFSNKIHDDYISYRERVLKDYSKESMFENAFDFALAKRVYIVCCENARIVSEHLSKERILSVINFNGNVIKECVDSFMHRYTDITDENEIFNLIDFSMCRYDKRG